MSFSTSIIEVVIGLVFVFSLLAILVTQINGIVSSVLNMRAKELKNAVNYLISDTHVRAKLLAHPTIKLVKAQVPVEVQLTTKQAKKVVDLAETTVDYIPPSAFIEALTSILLVDSDDSVYVPLQKAINNIPNSVEKSELRDLFHVLRTDFAEETIQEMYRVIDSVSDETLQAELTESLNAYETALQNIRYRDNRLIPLLQGINQIKDKRFRSALNSILITAQDIDDARDRLESWFNNGMQRANEQYKRNIMAISLIVSFILAVVLNVDTLHLGYTLWENPEARADAVLAASGFLESDLIETIQEQVEGGPFAPQSLQEPGESAMQGPETAEEVTARLVAAQQTVETLFALDLPIGWVYQPITQEMVRAADSLGLPSPRSNPRNLWSLWPPNNPNWLGLWIQKILGILATTIAAAQGAPFWFDLLNRITGTNSSSGGTSSSSNISR